MPDPATADEFAAYVAQHRVDFLDFGCSHGGSLQWGRRVLGGTEGLGIDTSQKKIEQARAAGLRAIRFDIGAIPERKLVRFTILSHFLEHVPDAREARRYLQRACQVSGEFVLVKQPYFDADGRLLRLGLKAYWSDWRGHPSPMSSLALYTMLRDLRAAGHLERFSIHARAPIVSSADARILPLAAPVDQHQYDPALHPPKPMDVAFDPPAYYETVAFITMPGVEHRAPFRRLPVDCTLYEG